MTKRLCSNKNLAALALFSVFLAVPFAVVGQTQIETHNNQYKVFDDVARVQGRIRDVPKTKAQEEIERNVRKNIRPPSTRYRTYSSTLGHNSISVSVPDNWRELPSTSKVRFAPGGAYGTQGITHGAMIGIANTDDSTLSMATTQHIDGVLEQSSYLRRQGSPQRTTLGGRAALSTRLVGVSPLTGRTERRTIITTLLSNSNTMFYFVAVVPEDQSSQYDRAFNEMLRSLTITER
jgi:hypothetical protein